MKQPNVPKAGEAPESVAHKKVHHRRKADHSQGEAAMAHDESNWLVSYADMMTLLFGFFVLMYSFSRVDEKKFEIVRKDVARYFGGQVKINPTVKKTEEEIKDVISNAGLDKKVEVVTRDSELELRFNGSLHFSPGTASLTSESQFVLNKLIDTIKRNIKADTVSVEGHTDDSPISTPVFPSNWELSSARASSVIREFEKFGFDASKLTTKGYGSSRPIAPNRDSKGMAIPDNQEANRRVIVTIGFTHEMDDAIRALKTGQFVSADAPELDKARTALIHQGEGEATWNEKVTHDINMTQEKLKLAEERLKETEDRARSARALADMQNRLKTMENRIVSSESEAQKYIKLAEEVKLGRMPASVKAKAAPKKVKAKPKKVVAPAAAAAAPATAPEPVVAPATEPAKQ
jgi:chemotaxis protein MotB